MKTGDYIYYRDKDGETIPAEILATKGARVKITALNPSKKIWVHKKNCQLQSEAE